jgi:hypothetical protein
MSSKRAKAIDRTVRPFGLNRPLVAVTQYDTEYGFSRDWGHPGIFGPFSDICKTSRGTLVKVTRPLGAACARMAGDWLSGSDCCKRGLDELSRVWVLQIGGNGIFYPCLAMASEGDLCAWAP